MRKSKFNVLLRDTFRKMEHLTATKGEEYSASDDQLADRKSVV